MSGHSKWSKIKRQKAAGDIKRGQMFTKLARSIALAVKEGGGIADTDKNVKLRLAVEKAKQANMPKSNIDRAIARASRKAGESGSLSRIVYEAYGPGGVALLVEAVTDNKQRTAASVKHVLDRGGGSLGAPGSVSFLFKHIGVITIPKGKANQEQLLEMAIQAGADDIEEKQDVLVIYTEHDKLHETKEYFERNGVSVRDFQLIYKPTSTAPVESDKKRSLESLIESLEGLDDVHAVYANLAY